MNRKERFFTGTIFPMIVCAENFAYFDRFLGLMGLADHKPVLPDPDAADVEFFTEYGLQESIYGAARERFLEPPLYRDTPDILIYLHQSRSLIAIEAKMFDLPNREALIEQMDRQRTYVLDYLCQALDIGPERVTHSLLLPQALESRASPLTHPCLTWEELHAEFVRDREEDYFLAVLRLALEAYDDLVAQAKTFGANADAFMSGGEIMRLYDLQQMPYLTMGCVGGLRGKRLQSELQSGNWKIRTYEVSSSKALTNRNWFTIADFVVLAKQHEGG